jgi:arginase
MNVQLLLVPYDTARRGWRSGAGPEHLINAGLVAHLESKGHVVAQPQVIEDDPAEPAAEIRTAFELARRLAVQVRAARAAGRFPLVLAGNCNSAVGTLAGLAPAHRAVFWFDAHGDLNTPATTASGFLDGTGLATALGLGWQTLVTTVPGFQPVTPELTWLLGVRDLDPAETDLIDRSPITLIPVERVRTRLSEILASAPLQGTEGYVHLDLDVLDPEVGRANSLPVPGGLMAEEVAQAIAAIRARTPLGAAAITSYAPEYDSGEGVWRAAFAAIDAMLD